MSGKKKLTASLQDVGRSTSLVASLNCAFVSNRLYLEFFFQHTLFIVVLFQKTTKKLFY